MPVKIKWNTVNFIAQEAALMSIALVSACLTTLHISMGNEGRGFAAGSLAVASGALLGKLLKETKRN